MANRLLAAVLVLAATCAACGGDTSTPTAPTPSPVPSQPAPLPPPRPTVVAVDVSGGNRIEGRSRTLQLRATARLSDGTSQDQTGAAAWSSSNSAVANVGAGLVTSVGFGVADISAMFQDVRGVVSVTVVPITIDFTVISEGFNIDPENRRGSSFLRNGQPFASLGRGFNVAAINQTTGELIEPARNFDTWGTRESGTAMRELVAFLNRMSNGTLLLIGVHDEAGLTRDHINCLPNPSPGSDCCRPNGYAWSDDALRTLEALGARDVRRYCYRNSYALIAVKGASARAEHLINRAQATARVTLALE